MTRLDANDSALEKLGMAQTGRLILASCDVPATPDQLHDWHNWCQSVGLDQTPLRMQQLVHRLVLHRSVDVFRTWKVEDVNAYTSQWPGEWLSIDLIPWAYGPDGRRYWNSWHVGGVVHCSYLIMAHLCGLPVSGDVAECCRVSDVSSALSDGVEPFPTPYPWVLKRGEKLPSLDD